MELDVMGWNGTAAGSAGAWALFCKLVLYPLLRTRRKATADGVDARTGDFYVPETAHFPLAALVTCAAFVLLAFATGQQVLPLVSAGFTGVALALGGHHVQGAAQHRREP